MPVPYGPAPSPDKPATQPHPSSGESAHLLSAQTGAENEAGAGFTAENEVGAGAGFTAVAGAGFTAVAGDGDGVRICLRPG